MARQSIQPALLYQPMHGVLMVPDLNKGERYVPVCWSPDFLWNSAIAADNYRRNSFVFVSYDICCQWSENTHTPVGACDGEGVERPVSASDGEGVEHHDAGFAERAWAETRVEGAWPLKMMGPGQRWDRLDNIKVTVSILFPARDDQIILRTLWMDASLQGAPAEGAPDLGQKATPQSSSYEGNRAMVQSHSRYDSVFCADEMMQKILDSTSEPISLADMGLVFQLGHSGAPCPVAPARIYTIRVLDVAGIQTLRYRLCGCANRSNRDQLMDMGWHALDGDDNHAASACATSEFLVLLHHYRRADN
ncbi:hypothetical protein B0H11DRAFT_1931047 [Mycena galericulata]|nr:hypothetical protein B0H11DRAFT_1931047 [Mycena galericulata]